MKTRLNFHSVVKLALAISLLIPLVTPFASQTERTKKLYLEPFQQSGPEGTLSDYDIRRQGIMNRREPTADQLAALNRLQQQIKGLEIRFNPVTGLPYHLFSLSQRLSAPSADDPVTVARDFLKTHRALFRRERQGIDDLVVVKNYRTDHTGVTHLIFHQFYGGLPVFQAGIKVNITRDGQVLSINGDYYPDIACSLTPELSAVEAVEHAIRAVAPDLVFTPTMKSSSAAADRATIFDRGPFTDDIRAKLVIFPVPTGARLAWNVRLHQMERLAWYDTMVDAQTGEVLFLYNLYRFNQPQGLVFEINPDRGPQVLKSFVGNATASPETWVNSLPNVRTQGNNALALPSAMNSDQHFAFPFTNAYNTNGPNQFDLDQQTLRFTPNAVGGYDVQLVPLSFDSNLGTNVTSMLSLFGRPDPDDGFFSLSLGFSFPFFGTNYSSVSVNANGFVSLGGSILSFSGSWSGLMLSLPRIAVLWNDLDAGSASAGGGVFAKTTSDSVTITWNRVPRFNQTDSNTAQLRLFQTGVIEISYNGVAATNTLVGVSRGGGDFNLEAVDFSASAPITGRRQGLAEKFPTRELDAAVTNLFYHLNFMHDYLYALGFNEAAGNFQVNNFGRGGLGNDPVLGFAQNSGFNNASFGTPEDGFSPVASFLFFTAPPFRQIDTDFDVDVMYHEYVHGLTNRLVGGPFNVAALFGAQSGAMGEGWSDIYSVSITNDPITGEYTTGNRETGVRRVNYAQSPLAYGDFGNRFGPVSAFFRGDPGGIALDRTFIPEVHDDGEIWASALWDLRTLLGRATFEQVITDALKLTPPNPTMLDARDAILIADVASSGGPRTAAIWSVFAARGMGVSARADRSDDSIVFQAFDSPSNPLPPGRETIFFDNMSNGVNGWTVTGSDGANGPALWHQSIRRGTTWYYGRESTGNYDTGQRNFGALTSPVINLPTVPPGSAMTLEFDHFLRGEPFSSRFDKGYVRAVEAATGKVTQVACAIRDTLGGPAGTSFEHEEIDLSRFAGRSIRLQFYFDTLDRNRNTAEGWYIDNVRVSRRIR